MLSSFFVWLLSLCLINFCMNNSYITLLLFVTPHATPVDVAFTIKPIAVTGNVAVVGVLKLVAKISTGFDSVENVL